MSSGNGYLLLVLSILTFVPFLLGLKGIFDFNKIENGSKYYMSVNNLIFGSMMCIVLILHVIYMLHWGWISSVKKNFYYYIIFWVLSLVFFIGGLYGIINKERINDAGFYRLSTQQFAMGLVAAIVLIAFWFKVHGQIPDLN